jgi:hypothetical protein
VPTPRTAGSGKLFPVADPAFRLRRPAGMVMARPS